MLACLLAACAAEDHEPQRPPRRAQPAAAEPQALTRPGFCDRGGDDGIRDLFCGATQPTLRSFVDLQRALRLTPGPTDHDAMYLGDVYVRFAVLLGHSTALSGHLVSPINPRALILGAGSVVAFVRGVQQVELATLARDRHAFNFYLLTFEQACQHEPEGCTPADLYTSRIERDWIAYTLRDDEDLKDTVLDCRQCHQRGRQGGGLLMRELTPPWTHFFEPVTSPLTGLVPTTPAAHGGDLLSDYLAAHGDEAYANVDVAGLPRATASILQQAVGADQPLVFDSMVIEQERYPLRDGEYPAEPLTSSTWESAYEAFKRGEQLALPYIEARAADPAKQAALSNAYQRHRAGELSDDELPDLADIFPDDPALRARIGLQTEPDASPEEALIQACGPCHNDVLDQSLSRARFNIDVSRLGSAELDQAIERLSLDRDSPRAMPPRGARQLDDDSRQRLVEYLRTDARSGRSNTKLARAARLGMSGGVAANP
ncbi:MAG TPA: c-type cytochrome [Polyangiales bacterium]|nr:c-type cytochrome [Polyangiales bacterium]